MDKIDKTDRQTESDLAGGNGEQRSRERARVQSEKDPAGKQAPFPTREDSANEAAKRTGPRDASPDDERATHTAAQRPSAPMSQSGASIKDFE